jgi:WD40 repeat protein
MAFSPDDSVLAVGSTSGGIRLWDTARVPVSLVANLSGHTNQVDDLAFSPDGAMLASADLDSTVVLWTVLENTVDGYNDPAGAAAFNPSATELAVASAPGGKVGVTLYTVPGRRKVTSFISAVPKAKWVSALAYSPNGQTLAVATNDPAGTVQLWDIARHQVIGTIHTYQIPYIESLAFSPHGNLLVTAGYSDPVIRLWNPADQRPAGTLPGNSGYEGAPRAIPGAWSIAFSPNGTELAAADSDSIIRLWDMPASGASPQLLSAPATASGSNASTVRGVAFSRNGAYLAGGYGNGDAAVWRASCLSCAPKVLHSDNESITSIGFTVDGQSLVTASQDGYVRLWPVGTWTAPETLQASGQSIVATVSPVGTLLATADGNAVRLWDTNEKHVAMWICQTLEAPVARSAWTQYGLTQFPYTPIC